MIFSNLVDKIIQQVSLNLVYTYFDLIDHFLVEDIGYQGEEKVEDLGDVIDTMYEGPKDELLGK